MVVDDNMINRLVTKRLLESIGSQTKVVDSGKECLRLLKERPESEDPYDVLLLDLMMPEVNFSLQNFPHFPFFSSFSIFLSCTSCFYLPSIFTYIHRFSIEFPSFSSIFLTELTFF